MNSKKILSLVLLSAGYASLISAATTPECASHQFIPRGASTDLTWIDALTRYDVLHRKEKFIYTSTSIYQQSTHNKRFASSFLLGDGNNFINVNTVPVAGTVVNATELGLARVDPLTGPFTSLFTIKPTRKQFTYLGNFYFKLDDWWCGLWGDITFGITNVHHRLNCTEVTNGSDLYPHLSFISNGIPDVSTSLSSRPDLNYSQFYCGNCLDGKRRTGIEDIQVRLGYNYEWCDDAHVGIYGIVTIPAGRNPTQQFIFEPLVGSKHWSVGVGFMGDYAAWCCDDSNITLLTDFNYRYVLSHKECRTFDLMPNGTFSRYLLLVYPTDATTLANPFPAADITTFSVKVTPRSTIQWWIGLNYEYCDWDFEAGYNLYWRQREQIKTSSVADFTTTAGVYNLASGVAAVTASDATITSVGTADATFIPLTAANLNITSAEAGRVLSNKVYGAFSWMGCACNCFDWMAGFGASYEFVTGNSKCNALSSWAVFSKVAIGF